LHLLPSAAAAATVPLGTAAAGTVDAAGAAAAPALTARVPCVPGRVLIERPSGTGAFESEHTFDILECAPDPRPPPGNTMSTLAGPAGAAAGSSAFPGGAPAAASGAAAAATPPAGAAAGGAAATPAATPAPAAGPGSHGIVPQIQNVVATTNLGVALELKTIAMQARNAEYNPKRFAAVVMRIREPKTTALIFSSGKIVVTGAKSEDASKLASRKYARIIQKLGYAGARFTEFKVQNIVASCDVNFPVRLEGLSHGHHMFCSYEPELFPGLIYRMINPKIVLLIFVSGKVVLTGAKLRQEIYDAFNNIYHVLLQFRKPRPNAAPPAIAAPPAQ